MILTVALGLCGVLCIMLQPARKLLKGPMGGFAGKIFSSMFFCLAGVAGAAQRVRRGEPFNWQTAALLLGFCLACLGDIMLALEPVLENPEKDRNYARAMGAVPFFLAHALNLAVLLSKVELNPLLLLPAALLLPALFAVLWQRKILDFGREGVPLLIYGLLLGALLSAAAWTRSPLLWFALPASCLFALSDTALFLFIFGKKQENERVKTVWLVMFPYYLAQALMACAVVFV